MSQQGRNLSPVEPSWLRTCKILLGWRTRLCPISCFDVDTRSTSFQFILYLVSSVCAELVVSAASGEACPVCGAYPSGARCFFACIAAQILHSGVFYYSIYLIWRLFTIEEHQDPLDTPQTTKIPGFLPLLLNHNMQI